MIIINFLRGSGLTTHLQMSTNPFFLLGPAAPRLTGTYSKVLHSADHLCWLEAATYALELASCSNDVMYCVLCMGGTALPSLRPVLCLGAGWLAGWLAGWSWQLDDYSHRFHPNTLSNLPVPSYLSIVTINHRAKIETITNAKSFISSLIDGW
ncbi:uncharacterized protein BP01DRAFT_424246 [Aspergillus saccharolyticus JOP 1030-1]|uniref:Uncharacterized protein n=1 Tax=Aspergillus saccharolyticus JOP 1030-1 TaxID=1450539 RepID=A0A319AC54_9EURO|nr:hypothetical protein BP01DRAFT_424246 [Aspergillus saccharolyticus JOP 1030-1]PYH44492.1 hypothetical protein BP01DRAFT_424246 [Aspergillus saccharolyticus JOP 1030-1]